MFVNAALPLLDKEAASNALVLTAFCWASAPMLTVPGGPEVGAALTVCAI